LDLTAMNTCAPFLICQRRTTSRWERHQVSIGGVREVVREAQARHLMARFISKPVLPFEKRGVGTHVEEMLAALHQPHAHGEEAGDE
jgi:hypothetical protein